MLRRLTFASALVIVFDRRHSRDKPNAPGDRGLLPRPQRSRIRRLRKTARPSGSPVTTRVESDNSTKTETFTVPADASAAPTKVEAAPAALGRRGRAGGRGAGTRVTSPDGKWIARTQEKARPKDEPKYASDFEKRHHERFKGVTFDWKDFQRDGAAFPAPNPVAQPALQILLQRGCAAARRAEDARRPRHAAGGLDLASRAARLLAFTADPEFRDELKYDRSRSVDRDDRRQGHAADERRRRPQRRRLLARRQVPVLRRARSAPT